MNWKSRISPVVRAMQPAARIAERVANVAVHLQRPTVVGVIGSASAGLTALSDYLAGQPTPGARVDLMVSTDLVVRAARECGAMIRSHRHSDGSSSIEITSTDVTIWIDSGGLTFYSDCKEWLRKALDRVLPSAIAVRERREDGYRSDAIDLATFDSEQAVRIAASTLPLLDGGRCILLDGKPGVGKTTIAQIVARESRIGRVVVLDSCVVGHSSDGDITIATVSGCDIGAALRLLSPGVVIVDDVDKVSISLQAIEALRSSARLVILTANNGQYDDVLDGAFIRAGRVDEVFTIEPHQRGRESPFDTLSDEEWAEVSQWPVAYTNEVRKRLLARPGDIRLDDLRQRLTRKTRSGELLK